MTNRIITPKNYTLEATVMFDPVTGDTELRIKNRSAPVTTLHIAGLLMEHATSLVRQMLTQKPVAIVPPTTKEGVNNG